MAHPFLPKRKPGTDDIFPTPAAAGVWDTRPQAHLDKLAASIEVPHAENRIHSIPDPWARTILFDRALYDARHPFHNVVHDEWRGLLALLGLRDQRNFDGLTATEVNLQRTRAGDFLSVLSQLRPSDAQLISSDTSWDRFYIFKWQHQPTATSRPSPFAFTSPTTLVATGVDYGDVLNSDEIPWFRRTGQGRGLLTDPTDFLSASDRRSLAEWLLLISHRLTELTTRSTPRQNDLIRLLGAYARQLDATSAVPNASTALSSSSLGLTHGLYRFLDHPAKGDVSVVTDLEIVTGRPNAAKYVLVDPSVAEQWNELAKDVRIFRNRMLDRAGELSAKATSGSLEGGYSWCTPAFFFTDRLIFEGNPTPAFPGALPVKTEGPRVDRTVVLPLNPVVLELFTPHELADRVTIQWLPGGSAVCRFDLVVRSSSGRERLVRVQRTYAHEAMTRVQDLPLVGIWPNFRLEDAKWKAYYTFQFWPESTAEELVVKPWSDVERTPKAQRKHAIDDPNRRFQVYQSSAYPEALLCETPFYDPSLQRQSVARGILLLQRPEMTQPPAPGSIVVGIDFGSTGTNVYIREGSGEPTAILFGARVRKITDFDPGKFGDTCRDLFIPAKDWPAESILSVFHDFGDPRDGGDSGRIVLRDGHVLYADKNSSKFIVGDRRRVMSNLKWGQERERIIAQDFLMQICLQAAAEVAVRGASKADVRFSWPTAFSKRELMTFNGHWTKVTRDVSEVTGIQFHHDDQHDNREAIVATRFFSDYTKNGELLDIMGGAITVDIGGGTTDFAIWNQLELAAHSSVLLAGRDIFLGPVRRRPEILNEIDPQVPLDNLKSAHRDSAFDAQLDAIIARHGAAMIDALPIRQARQSVQGLLSIIETGLCGLAYYGGLMVRRLTDAQRFTPGGKIALFVGGNGSNLFRWCTLGASLPGTEIHERAAAAFRAGAGLPRDVRVEFHLSTKPKSEVAYGLVSEPLPHRVSEDFAQPMAGEAFAVSNEVRTWTDMPSVADVLAMRVSVDAKFPVFTGFLESMRRPMTEDIGDKLRSHVGRSFVKQKQEIEGAMKNNPHLHQDDLARHEPVFIVALKRYLELETDAWERRR